jgi:hypothetical protein
MMQRSGITALFYIITTSSCKGVEGGGAGRVVGASPIIFDDFHLEITRRRNSGAGEKRNIVSLIIKN